MSLLFIFESTWSQREDSVLVCGGKHRLCISFVFLLFSFVDSVYTTEDVVLMNRKAELYCVIHRYFASVYSYNTDGVCILYLSEGVFSAGL